MPFPLNPSNEDLYIRYGRVYKFFTEENAWRSVEEELGTIDSGISKNSAISGQVLTWSAEQQQYTLQAKSNFIIQSVDTTNDLPLTGNQIGDIYFVESAWATYFWTGPGWYRILFVDSPPIITTTLSSTYNINVGNSEILTLSATDNENTPIVWSYEVSPDTADYQSAIVSQADNEFTISGADLGYSYSFTVTFTASSGYGSNSISAEFTIV